MNTPRLARIQAVSGLLFSLFVHVFDGIPVALGVLYEIDDPFDNDFARAYEAAAERFSGDAER